jgi:hypothetical protein
MDNSKIYLSIKPNPNNLNNNTTSPGTATAIDNNRSPESDPMMGPLLKVIIVLIVFVLVLILLIIVVVIFTPLSSHLHIFIFSLHQFLSNNPELYQQMLFNNPQMQKLLEKNPELRHALSDPATLKSMMTAATNPKAYNEMLRGHDRALSNLENIPEGFSHLKRVYSTLQEPMYEALTPQTKLTSSATTTITSPKNDKISSSTTTSEPIPNPWAPKQHQHNHKPSPIASPIVSPSSLSSHSQKRKLPSSASFDNDFLSSPSVNVQFQDQLEALHQLGFDNDEDENIPALLATNGHVPAAIDRILSRRK